MIYDDDKEKVMNYLTDLKKENGSKSIEHRINHKDGSVHWISNTSTIQIKNNNMIETGFLLDITERKKAERARELVITELQDALDNIKTLNGLLPICSSCKKIRDDNGYWQQVELYIKENSDADFSHSLCPDCANELYGKEKWYKNTYK